MLFHYTIRGFYVYSPPTDMRKGIYALCGLIQNELQRSPLSGELFIFVNRSKCMIKMLHWQTDGYGVFYKRLEQGTFEVPESGVLSCEQVLFLLQGVELKTVRRRKRFASEIEQ